MSARKPLSWVAAVLDQLTDRLAGAAGGHPAAWGGADRRPPSLGELDLHLIGRGRHERLWRVLGAHPRRRPTARGPVDGVSFALWAPNAADVRVFGDFNGWDPVPHALRPLGVSGVWQTFVPGARAGDRYLFRVLGADGRWREKADPLAFAAERPPGTASVVYTSGYTWGDQEWLARRAATDWHGRPVSVYEVHLGCWRHGRDYRQLARELGGYLQHHGFTHAGLLPVAEHPYSGSWGYQVSSYYAPTARYGDPDGFRALVDGLHRRGIGVIMDWVPAHFPRDPWALARFDGTAQYEHPDPVRGEHPDFGTLVFDYGRPQVRNFLVANALYWLEEFHLDGLRMDAVSSMLYLDHSRAPGRWTPNAAGGPENWEAVGLLREVNTAVHRAHPGVLTIAAESATWPGVTAPADQGGLGFDLKWDLGWAQDVLGHLGRPPAQRHGRHHDLTFPLTYAWDERYLLPLSHLEAVHGRGSLWQRMPGPAPRRAAGLRTLLAWTWAHPGKQLLFMGGEFGQPAAWGEGGSLDWGALDDPAEGRLHRGIAELVTEVNRLYRALPALYSADGRPEGFSWLAADDAANAVAAFLRHGTDGSVLVCVANLSGVPAPGYRVGVPRPGRWRVVLNTDAPAFGGAGQGSTGTLPAAPLRWQGLGYAVTADLPAQGVLWLVPDPG
ncbi:MULTISPECIES: 1,4-alpha-glucan branching protein GlgB [Streptomycetaceae]|uniref:1,4-alpha-glucan branching enzyme GlgB n=1 Tax=Streptantibioticus cattleyicolor (strain ATCC 35852 / DSM 46488 / JCM 4925 / NBRC 14057 / NRRL 8057) TaxID=1003195 RepID=F8JPF8_STREN|nr:MULTISPECIES: 1,4-alpha-glucan branching protein GlgB [Streptomycetaceae]AEW96516.1 glycogen branching enzyme [Streptantibioticus cattleyicolor NRRL 8057 = DSM 46488]MYS61018.1 1,4-alpha-glucan branching protein GlgB [Streptomyces sp. SID5468]CCB76853.1 1,4-alpha-glucan-branching enzyme [Streptantibioticus cattleyicolor NRRL 8057 = DSM 46488]